MEKRTVDQVLGGVVMVHWLFCCGVVVVRGRLVVMAFGGGDDFIRNSCTCATAAVRHRETRRRSDPHVAATEISGRESG